MLKKRKTDFEEFKVLTSKGLQATCADEIKGLKENV